MCYSRNNCGVELVNWLREHRWEFWRQKWERQRWTDERGFDGRFPWLVLSLLHPPQWFGGGATAIVCGVLPWEMRKCGFYCVVGQLLWGQVWCGGSKRKRPQWFCQRMQENGRRFNLWAIMVVDCFCWCMLRDDGLLSALLASTAKNCDMLKTATPTLHTT